MSLHIASYQLRSLPLALLLTCLQENVDLPDSEFQQLSSTGWDKLVREAAKHAVSGLLYHRLSNGLSAVEIPGPIIDRLRSDYLDNALKNMRLIQELSRVLKVCAAAGIQVIVLKGAYLAQVVYGNVALRSMNDLDILVRECDLEKIENKLQELGYQFWPEAGVTRERHYHFRYYSPITEIFLELHWHLQPPSLLYRLDLERFW